VLVSLAALQVLTPGFLNDIIANLWPNISIVGRDMTKSIVEPMFASMLPSPLNSLHFAKIDLGKVPIKLSNVDTHKMASGAIKMDLDVDWDGECDIELDGKMIPKIGIEHIKLNGRLSILLGPIINQMPLVSDAKAKLMYQIGAAQVAFINPPYLKFKYTDVAAVANIGFIDRSISNVVQSIMAGMAVLPNRFLVKLDAKNDWFSTFQFPLGVLKVRRGLPRCADSRSQLRAVPNSARPRRARASSRSSCTTRPTASSTRLSALRSGVPRRSTTTASPSGTRRTTSSSRTTTRS
jgi:hypothetical protein